MINPAHFFTALSKRGVDFYAGVPDSLLANFCAFVDEKGGDGKHLITSNEGNAVALAVGFHMSTGKYAAVYMQNSGLGNSINPLVSLADAEVYKVPMLLIIGWRGEPGLKDEPQHVKQGRITLEQLKLLEIPYFIIEASTCVEDVLNDAFTQLKKLNAPVALVVRKNTFEKYVSKVKAPEMSNFVREDALKKILELCETNDLIVSTTGKTSRELFELREKNDDLQRDFLTVGGMGHTSSIALGVAIGHPDRRVICLDGDGSLLMHLGALPVISNYNPGNFIHILLNNGSHESVGGQATSARLINFEMFAKSVGYQNYACAFDNASLYEAWNEIMREAGPSLLEIKIRNWSRSDLGRPTRSPEQNKDAFMKAAGIE